MVPLSPNPLPFPFASATNAGAVPLSHVGILLRIWVPPEARVSPPSRKRHVKTGFSPLGIDHVRDGFKMIWVHAKPIPAQMIQFQARRYGSVKDFVTNAMGFHGRGGRRLPTQLPIASPVGCPKPIPALFNRPVLNPAPESLCGRPDSPRKVGKIGKSAILGEGLIMPAAHTASLFWLQAVRDNAMPHNLPHATWRSYQSTMMGGKT